MGTRNMFGGNIACLDVNKNLIKTVFLSKSKVTITFGFEDLRIFKCFKSLLPCLYCAEIIGEDVRKLNSYFIYARDMIDRTQNILKIPSAKL